MKISEIKELIKLINETEINELELEMSDTRLVLRKGGVEVSGVQYQTVPIVQSQMPTAPTKVEISDVPASPAKEEIPAITGTPIKAPMVGTFYSSPRPDVDSFVKLGDKVTAGQTLCIIEAMKLMNEIETEFSGKIVDILVENGQPVEYGQTLFVIDTEK